MKWSLDSWKNFEAKQLPTYANKVKLDEVLTNLSSLPPLIFAGETRSLKSHIYQVQKGESFYLQGGDCAESFSELNPNTIRDTFKLLLQMSVVLTFATNKSTVKLVESVVSLLNLEVLILRKKMGKNYLVTEAI